MKNLKKTPQLFFCLLLVNLLFVGCSKDDVATEATTPVVITTETTPTTTTAYKGTFVSSAHTTSGTVLVNTEKTLLNFSNFKSDTGPDLDIYLASNLSNINSDYINLGDIKGLNGSYAYNLPTNTDLAKYKYVVVWCVDFNVNFGYATLAL